MILVFLGMGYDLFLSDATIEKMGKERIVPNYVILIIASFVPVYNTIIILELAFYQIVGCILWCYVEYKCGILNIDDYDDESIT